MPNDPRPLWLRIFCESFWGTRSVAKIGGMSLPLAAMISVMSELSPRICVGAFLLFAMAACFALSGILANDVADRDVDRATGKQRWIQSFPGAGGLAITVLVAALGVVPAIMAPVPWRVAGVYLLAVMLGFAYSLHPFRLKVRGLVGFLAFTSCIVLCYVGVPWTWFGGDWKPVVLTGAAVFFDRWINLHFHQIVDHAADAQEGQTT
ncbi:MAG: UbiA family prenyltransferase, partial [Kiritimatiellae bacterium]|nr:UbiA family prenyltransferase [Kiritimatiellia bacterium]